MQILKHFLQKKSFWLAIILFSVICSKNLVLASDTNVSVSYEPAAPNFSTGKQNVVTVVLRPTGGGISAATVVLHTTGGVKMVNVLDPLQLDNTPLANTKYISQEISEKSLKLTLLVLRATSDLPTTIKIPVVVSGSKAGNLQIDTKESQIIDGKGIAYTFSPTKASYITFSETGKNSVAPPTPTQLPENSLSVNLTMKFQGIKSSRLSTKTMSGVKVQLAKGTGKTAQDSLPQFISVKVGTDGLWHGSVVFPNVKSTDTYAILIKGPKHLQKRICQNNPTEKTQGAYECVGGEIKLDAENKDITTSGITMMTGDIGLQDSILNAYDLSFIQNTIQKTGKNVSADADVNYDGKVNKIDYDLVRYSLTHTSGQDQL